MKKLHTKNCKKEEKQISIDEMPKDDDDIEVRGADILKDNNVDVDFEVQKKIELEQLKKELLKLSEDDYKIIKALFFNEQTVRKYAKQTGIPVMTIQNRKMKILEKLKKILKN